MNQEIKQRIDLLKKGKIPNGYKKTKAGIMPTDWKIDVKAKKTFANYTDKKHDGKLQILSATQENGIVPRNQIDIDIKCSEKGIKGYKRVQKGDFVISLRSFQGGIEYSNYDGIVSPAYTVLKPICPISDEYYKNYFKTIDFIKRLNGAIYGIRDGKQIGYEDFSDLILHNPPLEEQKKIAEILMQCDKVIELYEQEIDELKKLKKAYLRKMFPQKGQNVPELRFAGFTDPWEQRKLSDISSLITKGTTPKDKSGDGEVNFIKVENIDDFSGEITGMSKISLEEHQGYLKRSQLQEDDILFSIAGTLGRVTSVNKEILPANTNQALSIIRLKKGNLEYVKTCLKGNVVSDFTRRNPTVGAQPNLSLEQVSSLEISMPSEDEQEKVGSYFRNFDDIIALHQRKLEEQKNQKKSLMQLLLTGIVRVKI